MQSVQLAVYWIHFRAVLRQLSTCSASKGKRRFVSRLVVRTSPLRRSGVDHTVLPANTPHLPLPRSSQEGATTEWTVIAPADEAYYSLIDPVRMKGWVGLVGWPTADGLPILMLTQQLQVWCRPVKVSLSTTHAALEVSSVIKTFTTDGSLIRCAVCFHFCCMSLNEALALLGTET